MSVCPSVTRRYSVETAKHIIKRFLPSGSHTTLSFWLEHCDTVGLEEPNSIAIFQRGPPTGELNAGGIEKMVTFD